MMSTWAFLKSYFLLFQLLIFFSSLSNAKIWIVWFHLICLPYSFSILNIWFPHIYMQYCTENKSMWKHSMYKSPAPPETFLFLYMHGDQNEFEKIVFDSKEKLRESQFWVISRIDEATVIQSASSTQTNTGANQHRQSRHLCSISQSQCH